MLDACHKTQHIINSQLLNEKKVTYQIKTPYCILPEGCYSIPDKGNASDDDRLFIVTNDSAVREALISALNEQLEKRRKITPTLFNELLDDALTSLGQRNKQCDLAFLLMHPSGCLVAQMGRSRVLHVSALNHELDYDSRNQIQDYNTKARAEVLKELNDGDVIIITLADRVDGHKLCQVVTDPGMSDQLGPQLHKALSINRDEAPASYIIQFQQVKGGALMSLPDINWKWITLFVLLAALIAGVAMLSLNGGLKLPKFGSDEVTTEMQTDTLPSDTLARDSLVPALLEEQPSETAPQDEKPKKETARKDTAQAPKAEVTTVKDEHPTQSTPQEVAPETHPEPKVSEPATPPTPPPAEPEP